MPYLVVADNIRIYYEVLGAGEPIVFLNGIFMNTKSWYFQYSDLSNYYKIILHDMRGQGKSDKPREEDKYSLRIHADDLRKLLDHLGIEKAHLVGTSYGGEVALEFAVNYPERVRKLIVITAASEIHLDLELSALRWMEGAGTRDPYKFVLSWINDVYSQEFLNKNGWGFIKRLIDVYSKDFDFDAAMLLLKSFLELRKKPLTPRLREINIPTLVVAAEEDRIKPPKYSKIIADNITGSRFFIVHGAGHAVVIEKPEIINVLIRGFL